MTRKQFRLTFIAGALALAGVAVGLMLYALRDSVALFMSPTDIAEKDPAPGARLRIDLENFPHLALWARPPAPFLCIEAWTGHGDPVGFEGEISQKPSMRLLGPGETGRHTARFSFTTADATPRPLGAARSV